MGNPGPAQTLTMGTVVGGDSAGAEFTGPAPNQTLNLILPKGDQGDASTVPGPANTLSIGTVTAGDSAGAEITGTSPNQTINLTLPKGDTGGTFSILQVAELPEIVDSSTLYLIG